MKGHIYFRNYMIERGTGKPGFRWCQGYNQMTPDGTGVYYPAKTRREAQRDARSEGVKARFFETQEEAKSFIDKQH